MRAYTKIVLFCLLSSVLCAPAGAQATVNSERQILTPKPGPAPKINGPKVYGARPGRPFLYRIPCTGRRPITFAAEGLPPSLTLDAQTGIITGRTPDKGEYAVTLKASNRSGSDSRTFKLVAGDTLALTPPMGWNDWYTHYHRITDTLVRQAADAMVASGMADFGYQYINIDDCWMVKSSSNDPRIGGQPERDSNGAIRSNGNFPDMKALTAYIHSKGLKAGIYTSPGPLTCAGYTASYQHESDDARRFAEWGFDFLKYDWCSYGRIAKAKTIEEYKKPYQQMGAILEKLERDVVFNLCQYGMGNVWEWGGDAGGHCWRTTGDLGWEKDTHLPGFYSIAFQNAAHSDFAGPGRWNDPDYILIGRIGNARDNDEAPKPTTLTADEQYSYMSLWVLMAAPLFFSGDMNYLDEFTLNVLCNSEVIAVDQDPLGKQGRVIRHTEGEFILAKPMEDGSLAVGLFNLGDSPRTIGVSWEEIGVQGQQRVRDLWRQKDTGIADGRYSAAVNRHGVALVRLAPSARR